MSILLLLIPLSLVLLGLAVWAFFWAAGSGQYDDLEGPAWRILLDDEKKPPRETDAMTSKPDVAGANKKP